MLKRFLAFLGVLRVERCGSCEFFTYGIDIEQRSLICECKHPDVPEAVSLRVKRGYKGCMWNEVKAKYTDNESLAT